ncbi:efflux transporter, outer membrane factor (OMF) lipoprotein, NodT family [Paraburkholderia fungorum]|uniref:Efflux transporter, outer membrane factor (OMF) lipoprotein, NodT family n=1 Tax=Paraburkholderia fungorum TaxID=134537 RepID=A0A1H1JZY5_9BURK|nr:efflux transporter outer membrane subunit [Paraburkholderia fungorum]SDR55350.1 efflux transporter, outer membrane factor (OMF) lipoprotein, NodT family [Paraburkholderia fungorum]
MSLLTSRFAAGVSLLAMAGLTACTVGPDFQRPAAALPAHWRTDTRQPDADIAGTLSPVVDGTPDSQWWEVFHDAELTSLIQRVTASSLDVKAAAARLLQARAARGVSGADALPSVAGTASWQHARSSQNGVLDISGLEGKHDYNVWQPGVDASWELDLWGRVRREVESSDAAVEAAADLRRDVLLMTLADTASDYMQLRGIQAQQKIVEQNLEMARHSLELTQIRFADGVATRLDMAEASAQVSTIEAQLPLLDNRRVHLVNALSLLMGAPPRTLDNELREYAPIPSMPSRVPAGLPSELAERRPDIRVAEARLHAATANIGVAVGDFYPRITLSANFSLQAMHFSDLDSWDSRMFGVGPALSVPLFDGGRLKGQLALRNAQQQEAAIDFQRTVLNAWHDVDNAMTEYEARQNNRDKLAKAVEQNQIALENAQRQYIAGATDFLNVLTVQKDLLGTQQALASSSADVAVSLVSLYKALGGGWQSVFPVQPDRNRAGEQEARSGQSGHHDHV